MRTADSVGRPAADPVSPAAGVTRAVRGAWFAFLVDLFDVFCPVIVLAPAMNYFLAPTLTFSERAMIANIILVSTLIARPVGSAIFGHIGDRFGRRRTTILSATGFGITTLAIAALPGHAAWGGGALVALIALRFLDGIFLGGGYAGANPLAMERSPKHKRGLYSGVINTAFPVAYVVLSLLTLLLLSVMSNGSPTSSYSTWGWRIAFVIGGLMGLVLAVHYARSIRESAPDEAVKQASAPLKTVLIGSGARSFWQVLVLMTGLWMLAYTCSGVLPVLLQSPLGLNIAPRPATVVLAVTFTAGAAGYVCAGALSQRLGRRRFLIAGSVVSATAGVGAYALLVTRSDANLAVVAIVAAATVVLVVSPFGVSIAYISERFHIGVRSTGYALSYSLAIVIPAFYSFYQEWLSHVMDYKYTVLVLVVGGAVLMGVGAAMGPETRDVDLGAVSQNAIFGLHAGHAR